MAETLALQIRANNLEGTGAKDPRVTVSLQNVQSQTVIYQAVVHDFSGQVELTIPKPETPDTLRLEVGFSRFDVPEATFFMPWGKTRHVFDFQLIRLPSEWIPKFTPLSETASPRFDRLKTVLAVSKEVDLKIGEQIGDLHERYDMLSGIEQTLAKTALLNLYAVLCDELDPIAEVPWFDHVRRIVRLDRERFLAEVSPTLFENVQTILNEMDPKYRMAGYFTEASSALHNQNIPASYGEPEKMITVKKDYFQGNLQLTLSFFRVEGKPIHLLDCDLDENRNLLLHGCDICKHEFTGGTNPIFMHEYIVRDSAERNFEHISTVDLGYVLT